VNTEPTKSLSVLVVGGGIAGLTTAVALRRAGHRVEVLEVKPDWAVTGWGLSLTGPALRALASVGLDSACIDAGYGIRAITNCGADGTLLNTIELPSLLGADRPAQIGLGRPVLSRILRDAAEKHGATLHTNLTVNSVHDAADGIRAVLSDGSVRSVDLIVGADGVGSRMRKVIGIDETPVFTDQCVWRVIVDRPKWAESLFTFTAPNHSSGLIPISDSQAYIFCTECTDRSDPVSDEDRVTAMRDLLAPLAGRMDKVVNGIEDPERVVRRPILNLHVDGPWHRGRCVLIGDAVHTGGPQMVSGAALAIEDAVLLPEHLAAHADMEDALRTFHERRHGRTRLVVGTTLEIGKLERAHRYADVHTLQRGCHAEMAKAI
jgi:2-polyprenyl-6-methoxyphenol hydroxylase-like FAD-dependent oxidoreductase